MTIVYINSVCNIGSTGRIAVELYKKDEMDGKEVYFAFGRGTTNDADVKTIKIGNKFDLCFHGLISRLFDLHGFGSKRATIKFLKKLDSIKPDVIHLHNIHGYYINIRLLFDYIKENDISVRWTLHDCWALTGHCSFAGEEIGCKKWKSHCNKCPLVKEYPRSLIDRSYRNFELKKKIFSGVKNMEIITPSHWLADVVAESYLKNYHVKVEKNRVDLTPFHNTPSKFRVDNRIDNKFLILSVGFFWDTWKFNDIVKVANLLEVDEVLVIVGMNRKMSDKLPSNVICVPKTNSREELAKIYSAADVFINPTYADNYPTVNLEAESCGTPVITYDTGGCRETICNQNSKAVLRGDIMQLMKEVRKIKNSSKD